MSGEFKQDIFERKSRSQVKFDGYISTRDVTISEQPPLDSDIADSTDSDPGKPIFKDVVFTSFGVDIRDVKLSGDRDMSLFVIFSGGTRREKDYFEPILLHPQCFPKLIIGIITGTDQVERLYKEAIDKKETLGGFDISIGDRICIVTDVDSFTDDIKRIQPLCIKDDIDLIISNPCFELWLYYSYLNNRPLFKPSSDECKSSEFKTHVNRVIPGGVNPNKDLHRIDVAIKNSKENYSETDGFPDFLSTQMHLLAERLSPLVEDGLSKLDALEEQRRQRYLGSKV